MPIIKSAKKALRQNKKNHEHNTALKDNYKKVKKDITKLLEEKKEKEAKGLLPMFYKHIDKAVKKGILKKNTAARKKATLAKIL